MLAETRALHANSTRHYQFLRQVCRSILADSNLRSAEPKPVAFGPFGELIMPYYVMGAIDTLDLFGLDELIIFSFYNANRGIYRRAVDVGANLGLHSIVMARCGFHVTAYEPDPVHFDLLARNIALNKVTGIDPVKAAVSDHDGTMEFVRVKGNTTGSHLAGAKANPYGELERFPVTVKNFPASVDGADLVKIDAEGHETTILRALPPQRWRNLDAILEVGTADNAAAILDHFRKLPVNLYSQKTGWSRVTELSHMPASHRDGSLFITARHEMSWG